MSFLDKLRNQNSSSIADEFWIELIVCSKLAIDTITTESELEKKLQQEILNRISDPDPERSMSVGQMVQCLQILKKKKSEDLASILGILKQQIVTQQTKQPDDVPKNDKPEKELNPLSKEKVKDTKEILEFIDLLTKNKEGEIQ